MVLWSKRKRTTTNMATRKQSALDKVKLHFEELPQRIYTLNKRTRKERSDESSLSR